jgi:ABC-type transport system involved in multi-copper enzyme maturation permease subunit
MLIVWRQTMRECLRRRVFLIVPIGTVVYLALYALGTRTAFNSVDGLPTRSVGVVLEEQIVVGATLSGLSLFCTLFLASVIGVFLTFNSVRGDAESGVLQAILVRPLGRFSYLAGKYVGAALTAVLYGMFLYLCSMATTEIMGDWHPDRPLVTALYLAGGIAVVTLLSLIGSVFLSTIANGIGVFMLYGAGLLAGLLEQIGSAINSPDLERLGTIAAWVLPFEALYQAALATLTADTSGLTGFVVRLGPLGGAHPGGIDLVIYSLAYVAILGGLGSFVFSKKDL